MTRASVPEIGGTASSLLHGVLTGPPVNAQLVGAGPFAVTLASGHDVVVLSRPGAVRLPIAVQVPVLPHPREAPFVVGGGTIRAGSWRCGVRRWFDPIARVRSIDGASARHLHEHLSSTDALDPLLPDNALDDLAAGLLADPGDVVARLVGLGGGTTPSGDDLLAGALAALRATGHPAAAALGLATRRIAPRTTTLSAALLRAADKAAVIPAFGALLGDLAAGTDPVPAAHRLIAVGHRSGWHLAAGLTAALAATPAPEAVVS